MQFFKKSLGILMIVLVIGAVVATGMYIFLVKDSQILNLNTTEPVKMTDQQSTKVNSDYSIETATEDVEGAPGSLRLGFNNADQVVAADSGTNMVWVANGKLQFVVRTKDGAITSTTTLDEGQITLPAITRSDLLVSVAWVKQKKVLGVVSTDGGITFGEIKNIGMGSGVSLASSGDNIVAVWHDDTNASTSKVLLSRYNGTVSNPEWSSPERIDESSKEPLWASVAMNDNDLYVTWRDNRNGEYNVWFRRYVNSSWQGEQNLISAKSGDPDICVNSEYVAIAHHGKRQISLLLSTDGGETFVTGVDLGSGSFAHISCSDKMIAVAWEYTIESVKSPGKQTGWAIYDMSGDIISGTIEDGSIAASTAYIIPGTPFVEFLWIVVGDSPLVGTLRHQVIKLY